MLKEPHIRHKRDQCRCVMYGITHIHCLKNPYLTSAYSRTNYVLENQFPYHTLHVGSLKSSFDQEVCFNVDDDKLPFHHFDWFRTFGVFRNRKIPRKSKLMVEGWVDRVWFVGYDICWWWFYFVSWCHGATGDWLSVQCKFTCLYSRLRFILQ